MVGILKQEKIILKSAPFPIRDVGDPIAHGVSLIMKAVVLYSLSAAPAGS